MNNRGIVNIFGLIPDIVIVARSQQIRLALKVDFNRITFDLLARHFLTSTSSAPFRSSRSTILAPRCSQYILVFFPLPDLSVQ